MMNLSIKIVYILIINPIFQFKGCLLTVKMFARFIVDFYNLKENLLCDH